jgi:hypothetical protein
LLVEDAVRWRKPVESAFGSLAVVAVACVERESLAAVAWMEPALRMARATELAEAVRENADLATAGGRENGETGIESMSPKLSPSENVVHGSSPSNPALKIVNAIRYTWR